MLNSNSYDTSLAQRLQTNRLNKRDYINQDRQPYQYQAPTKNIETLRKKTLKQKIKRLKNYSFFFEKRPH